MLWAFEFCRQSCTGRRKHNQKLTAPFLLSKPLSSSVCCCCSTQRLLTSTALHFDCSTFRHMDLTFCLEDVLGTRWGRTIHPFCDKALFQVFTRLAPTKNVVLSLFLGNGWFKTFEERYGKHERHHAAIVWNNIQKAVEDVCKLNENSRRGESSRAERP